MDHSALHGLRDCGETKQPTPIPPSPALWLTCLRSPPGLCPGTAEQEEISSSSGSTSPGALSLMQLSTCQYSICTASCKEAVWPSEESRELILMEIIRRANYNFVLFCFAGINSLDQFSEWHTQVCLHNASGEHPAVKAAHSITVLLFGYLCCWSLAQDYVC